MYIQEATTRWSTIENNTEYVARPFAIENWVSQVTAGLVKRKSSNRKWLFFFMMNSMRNENKKTLFFKGQCNYYAIDVLVFICMLIIYIYIHDFPAIYHRPRSMILFDQISCITSWANINLDFPVRYFFLIDIIFTYLFSLSIDHQKELLLSFYFILLYNIRVKILENKLSMNICYQKNMRYWYISARYLLIENSIHTTNLIWLEGTRKSKTSHLEERHHNHMYDVIFLRDQKVEECELARAQQDI